MKPANPGILIIDGGSSGIRFALYQTGEPLKLMAAWEDRPYRIDWQEFDFP